MSAKKQRDKSRRRASKLARQAWDAAEEGRFDLAVRIIGRAVELHPGNPVLWHDSGTLLLQVQQDDKAARSFEAAIQVAPDFAEAYASLAAIRIRQGNAEQAVALQREAVRHAPSTERHGLALAAYEALAAAGNGSDVRRAAESRPQSDADQAGPSDTFADLAARVEMLDWPELAERLTAHGHAHVPALLCAERCATLRAMFDDDRLFAKTVTMNKSRFGRGVYRYFAAPVPSLVDALRTLLYPRVAEIANRWQRLLADKDTYPSTWSQFSDRCAAAGQTTPSPLMLRYEADGFNAPHQDLRGDVFFPLQLVVVLSPRAESGTAGVEAFTGGEFLLCDQPERKPSDRRTIAAGLGDAVLFCTRARPARVGGVYGLQPVKHGLTRVESGIRYAVGIPFHEFA